MAAEDQAQVGRVAVATIRSAGVSFTQNAKGGLSGAITRTSAGIYVVPLTNDLPTANCRAIVTPRATCLFNVVDTSATSKTINTFTGTVAAPVAADIDFDVEFGRIEP